MDAQHDLHRWIPDNIVWVHEIVTSLLKKKKLKLKHYLDYIIAETSIIDEITFVMLTKMYQIHIAVLYKFDYWTTNRSKHLDECDIMLPYRGKFQFSYTKQLEEVSLGTDVEFFFVDNKGYEHRIDMQEEHFLSEGPETITCCELDD